eukprot:SAG31_NODE_8255_length_1488_cov_1.162707_1_plen_143_part_00
MSCSRYEATRCRRPFVGGQPAAQGRRVGTSSLTLLGSLLASTVLMPADVLVETGRASCTRYFVQFCMANVSIRSYRITLRCDAQFYRIFLVQPVGIISRSLQGSPPWMQIRMEGILDKASMSDVHARRLIQIVWNLALGICA